MKRILFLSVLAALFMTACKNCNNEKEASDIAPEALRMYRNMYVFHADYLMDTLNDHFIKIDDGIILKINGDLAVYVDRGNWGSIVNNVPITTRFRFWTKPKGSPTPPESDTNFEELTYTLNLDDFERGKEKSMTIIQVISLKKRDDKNVINPPINPIGPIGPQFTGETK